jgi:hypothetical protein
MATAFFGSLSFFCKDAECVFVSGVLSKAKESATLELVVSYDN